jgi:hypothetical protein
MRMRITRIVDDVHFTPKAAAPMLQVADAVAFGFRRYLSQKEHGHAFAEAILGPNPEAGLSAIRTADCECGMFFKDPLKKSIDPFSGGV